MKKTVAILLFAFIGMISWGQSDSTALIPKYDSVAKATPGSLPSDSLFLNARAQDSTALSTQEEVSYRLPGKNPIYYFGSPFASHFFEIPVLIGVDNKDFDIGIGINYSYVPEVWGFNIQAMTSLEANWYMVGAIYRLSKPWNSFDWQVFGNVGLRHAHPLYRDDYTYLPTLSVGIRLAEPLLPIFLSSTNYSLSALTDFQRIYLMFGISIFVPFI